MKNTEIAQFVKIHKKNMLRMKPYSPSTRIAVRDSIDEDLSEDIDDDVFIRDGRAVSVDGNFEISHF